MKTRKMDYTKEGEEIEKNVVSDIICNIDFFLNDNIWEIYNACWSELKARGELKEETDKSWQNGFEEGQEYILSQVQGEISYQIGKM